MLLSHSLETSLPLGEDWGWTVTQTFHSGMLDLCKHCLHRLSHHPASLSQGQAIQTSDKTAHMQSRKVGLGLHGPAEGDHKHTNSLCFLSICASCTWALAEDNFTINPHNFQVKEVLWGIEKRIKRGLIPVICNLAPNCCFVDGYKNSNRVEL